MGFQPAKKIPKPRGHYQTREQTALFKVMSKFLGEDNNTIIRRFWWVCPDGYCDSEWLNSEIERIRSVLSNFTDGTKKKPATPPPLNMRGLLR